MRRRRFLKFVAAVGAVVAGVGAVVVKLLNGGDAEVLSDTVIQISGDFAGTIPTGTTGHIVGDVNLTGDLIVEGVLTGVDTFTLTGNGFQILAQNGGRLDLAGWHRSAWVRWGDNVSGTSIQPDWQVGDRLAVTPTKAGIYVPQFTTWTGDWVSMVRPVNSPDVTLPNGTVAKPEVANLAQTITFQNLRRIHFHDGAGVQSLKWLRVLDSGVAGVLGDYPIHFHLNGEASRGSVVEGVTVEGGKHHAFVPHASHGIVFRDCVAVTTVSHPFWWDAPLNRFHTANNTNDCLVERMLVLGASSSPGRLSGYVLGAGVGNTVRDSVAVGVVAGKDSSGFHWPESANNNAGGTVWTFQGNVSHNNQGDGIFVWQNDDPLHIISDFTAYRNGNTGIDHGAYTNQYHYVGGVLMGGSDATFKLHARPPNGGSILIEDYVADGRLALWVHQASGTEWVIVRRCAFPSVIYFETGNQGQHSSMVRYEDCGFTPAIFNLAGIHPNSLIEIVEAGMLTHRWAAGAWS